jgi:hypothetical protein
MKGIIKIALGIVLGVVLLIVVCGVIIAAGTNSDPEPTQEVADDSGDRTGSDDGGEKPEKPEKPKAKEDKPRAVTFARGKSKGDYAIVQAAGRASGQAPMHVRVTTEPSGQKAMVTWMIDLRERRRRRLPGRPVHRDHTDQPADA